MSVASDPDANIIMENHEFGMPPAHYAEWPVLNRTYNILSTTRDRRALCRCAIACRCCAASCFLTINHMVLRHALRNSIILAHFTGSAEHAEGAQCASHRPHTSMKLVV